MVHLGVAEVKRGRGHRGHKRTMCTSGCLMHSVTHWSVCTDCDTHWCVTHVKRGRGHKRTMLFGCTLVGYCVTHWCVHSVHTAIPMGGVLRTL